MLLSLDSVVRSYSLLRGRLDITHRRDIMTSLCINKRQTGYYDELTDLTNRQWAWIEPIFPPQEGARRRLPVNLRCVLDALIYTQRKRVCPIRSCQIGGSSRS